MTPAFVWTIFSLLGVFVAYWAAKDALRDRQALENATNGRRIVASGYLRGELIHFAVFGAWAIIGALAYDPDATPRWSEASLWLVVTLALLVVRSLLDAHDRLRVRRALHPPLAEL